MREKRSNSLSLYGAGGKALDKLFGYGQGNIQESLKLAGPIIWRHQSLTKICFERLLQNLLSFERASIDKKIAFRYIAICTAHSPVAQLAEQVAVNHWVPGSSPGGGASKKGTPKVCLFYYEGFLPGSKRSRGATGGERTSAGRRSSGGGGLEGGPRKDPTGRRGRAGEQAKKARQGCAFFITRTTAEIIPIGVT